MITDEQYQAVKPIYENLFVEANGQIDADTLIARIEGEPAVAAAFFDADHDEIYRRYQLERVNEFVRLYQHRQAVRMIGVYNRRNRLPTLEELNAPAPVSTVYKTETYVWTDEATAEAAEKYYRHGLTEIRNFGIYHDAWGQSETDMLMELDDLKRHIQAITAQRDLMPVA